MKKQTPAAEQFAALGIAESDYTHAMQVAIKQRWSGLRVDEKVADLRAAHDAVELPFVPTWQTIAAQHHGVDVDAIVEDGSGALLPDAIEEAKAEETRLRRNAAVNAWRERTKLRAAIDARDLKFAALRAKRGTKVAPPAPDAVTGDPAPARVAS